MEGTLKSREEIAKGTELFTFDLLGKEISFTPGQFIFVTIPNLLYPDDRGGRRQFSITNTPTQKGIIAIATRIRDSGFKKTLMEMPLGARVQLGPTAGRFVLPEDTQRPLVFIAGGIGIGPFMSMLRHIKEQALPYVITLLYSNKDKASTAFFTELKEMPGNIPGLSVIFSMTQDPSWQGETGRIDAGFVKKHIPDLQKPIFYVVGPPAMNAAIIQTLLEIQVAKENIRQESFAGY